MITFNEDFVLINDKFPHIGKRIELMWGSNECAVYINSLLTDTRDGKRKGFPREVADALFRLSNLHDVEFPYSALKIVDIWNQNNLR